MLIYWLTIALCVFGIVATLASLLRFDDWWIRAFDFPRVLISIILRFGILGLVACFLFDIGSRDWLFGLALVAVICLVFQLSKVYAYTRLASKEVLSTERINADERVSLLVSNVLTPNRRAGDLLGLIQLKKPDLILTLETDQWWQDQLDVLESDYPYTVKVPLENLYGMHLYSRLPLLDPEVRYLIQEDIPSIRTGVKLRSGKKVIFYCMHPVPPSPTENYASTDRDAELLMVAKEVEGENNSVIVAGDLNDVAWSYTTNLFQRISGLLDPRKGRGFFSTFHANYFFARWPLDHVFISNDFKLIDMERLPYIGSDHFPIFVDLQYQASAQFEQEKPESDAADQELVRQKIQNGKNGNEQTLINSVYTPGVHLLEISEGFLPALL